MSETRVVIIQCSKCGSRLRVKTRSADKVVPCPKCREQVTVSQPTELAATTKPLDRFLEAFDCPNCGSKLERDTRLIEEVVTCRECEQRIRVGARAPANGPASNRDATPPTYRLGHTVTITIKCRARITDYQYESKTSGGHIFDPVTTTETKESYKENFSLVQQCVNRPDTGASVETPVVCKVCGQKFLMQVGSKAAGREVGKVAFLLFVPALLLLIWWLIADLLSPTGPNLLQGDPASAVWLIRSLILVLMAMCLFFLGAGVCRWYDFIGWNIISGPVDGSDVTIEAPGTFKLFKKHVLQSVDEW